MQWRKLSPTSYSNRFHEQVTAEKMCDHLTKWSWSNITSRFNAILQLDINGTKFRRKRCIGYRKTAKYTLLVKGATLARTGRECKIQRVPRNRKEKQLERIRKGAIGIPGNEVSSKSVIKSTNGHSRSPHEPDLTPYSQVIAGLAGLLRRF